MCKQFVKGVFHGDICEGGKQIREGEEAVNIWVQMRSSLRLTPWEALKCKLYHEISPALRQGLGFCTPHCSVMIEVPGGGG